MERVLSTKEERLVEAIRRMESLDICSEVIEDLKSGTLNCSHHGMLFWISDELKAEVKDFEEKYSALIYHVIRTNTEFGEWWSCLYVSQHMNEWECDREELAEGIPCAVVFAGDCTDIGSIGIKSFAGGLLRTD